ncbi:hypothetical protein [Streptomyces sp. NPDC049879]|uniref:hypothetical protein n=1 Tax=Streptomyces sp. NPDC049879 TaxID=3365598 RepID=UPI0037A73EC8
MNCTACLAEGGRKIKAACLRKRPPAARGAERCKIRRRLRVLRWTLVVQALKGAAYAGGLGLVQAIVTRFLFR